MGLQIQAVEQRKKLHSNEEPADMGRVVFVE